MSANMVGLVEVPLEGGGQIVVKTVTDVTDGAPAPRGSGPVNASPRGDRVDGLVHQAHQSFTEAVEGIAALSVQARDQLRAVGPDEVCLEFGLEVEASASVVLTSVNSACHVTVTVTWKADRDGHDDS